MLGMVEIPAKAGASTPYSCLPAGREGGVKALPCTILGSGPVLSNGVYFEPSKMVTV
jgi:hypothetical protein